MRESIIPIVLAIVASTGFWAVVELIIRHLFDKKSLTSSALLGLLHDRIFDLCDKYIRQGYVTKDQYKNLLKLYRPYEKLGGNDVAKKLMKEVDKLPIREDENDNSDL